LILAGGRDTIASLSNSFHRSLHELFWPEAIQAATAARLVFEKLFSTCMTNIDMSRLHSGKGPCCDGGDTRRVDDDLAIKDDRYCARIDDEWVDIPNEPVAYRPNRTGRTMVWPYYLDVHPMARCCSPGRMG